MNAVSSTGLEVHALVRGQGFDQEVARDRRTTGCLIFNHPLHRIVPSRVGARILTMSHPCGIIRTTRVQAS
jgi:hypothetical protein